MTEIVRAIYDMMGKYTYPALTGDVPQQHVDAFFQVWVLMDAKSSASVRTLDPSHKLWSFFLENG